MICICTIIKNEHAYIREWVEYNLKLGFDAIYFYDNESSHGYENELGDYLGKQVFIKYWDNSNATDNVSDNNLQVNAYTDFIKSRKWTDDDWCAFIDVDEFLTIEKENIKETLKLYGDVSGILIAWKMYDANGHIYKQKNLLESYTHCSEISQISYSKELPYEAAFYKTFARLSRCIQGETCHSIIFTDDNVVASDLSIPVYREEPYRGKVKRIIIKYPSFKNMYIKHIYTKSMEDWAIRLKRGQITQGAKLDRNIETFFRFNPELELYRDKFSKEFDVEDTIEEYINYSEYGYYK